MSLSQQREPTKAFQIFSSFTLDLGHVQKDLFHNKKVCGGANKENVNAMPSRDTNIVETYLGQGGLLAFFTTIDIDVSI